MEKFKQHNKNTKQIYDFKVKGSSWDFGNEAELVAAGFSWPPRSYVCSFCKREFRSAQALGGHMNVHRRDRARLRQSPTRPDACFNSSKFSPLNLNLDPNPSFNPNPSSCPSNLPSCPPPPFSSLFTKFPHFTSKFPTRPAETTKALFGVERFDSWGKEKGMEDFKKRDFVRLDLEIGLVCESKEELDLELRLGYT